MNKSFRSKPVGWRGESYRHYLAAKGIKTKYCASMRSKIADKLESSYSKDRVNKEIRVLQEWNKGKREKFIKEKVEEGLSFSEAVLYADDVEEANRKQVRKDIKRRKAAKKFEDLDELSVSVAIQNVEGGLLGHNIRAMSDEELNEEKKKLEKDIEEQQQYFDPQGDNYGLENDIGVLKEFNEEIKWRKHEFFANKYFKLIRAKTDQGEWVHDDEKGESYFHVPGKRGEGFDGRTIELKDGKESVEMHGPWHGTASSMREETGVEVYDSHEPEWWVRKGLMSEEEAKGLRRVKDTYLKEALKGVSREKDPIVAESVDGVGVKLSELRLNVPDDPRVLRKKLRTGWTTGADYKESLFADDWETRKGSPFDPNERGKDIFIASDWGSKPLSDEKKLRVAEGMKHTFPTINRPLKRTLSGPEIPDDVESLKKLGYKKIGERYEL